MIIAIDAREMVGQIAGKGRYIFELVRNLAEIDAENQYILYSKQSIDLKLPKNFTKIVIGGTPGFRQLWMANDIVRRGADLFFAPTGFLPVIFSRIPTVVTVHDLAVFLCKEARPAFKTKVSERSMLGLAARKADRIISVSQSTKNDLEKVFHINPKKINVTLLGYDEAAYQPKDSGDQKVLDQYSLKPGYLLFVGTLEPRKNIVGILKAYAELDATLRHKYPLAISGKKGWFYEEIFSTVTELGLADTVTFLGRTPDDHLPALYRQAHCLVFPSFYEGFGLPPLEAIACGTPVLSSNNSSLPEVVGEAGLLIDPYDIKEMARAMGELMTDKKVYDKVKAATAGQAKKFSWKNMAKQTLAIFKETIHG